MSWMRAPSLFGLLALAGCAGTPTIRSAAPPPVINPDPPGLLQILRKPETSITALLGAPSMARSEGPARQLQFIRPPCVFDVFLYPTAESRVPLARTAVARAPDGTAMDAGRCLALIVPVAP
ncbi:MAG: hypothetical protein ACMVO5_08305 [Polymorphobacter sp.]|uniref:hypothetical protein n=1 Tax=Polymorphobacter sp. TaxID=1909290 RepID=UPI003A8B3624